jgi:drug/metabolite transporter (DMT)-like permease
MTAPDKPVTLRALPRHTLPALVLVIALGNAWSLQYASAKLIGDAGLPPFGSLFTVHVLLATAFIAMLSLRCELFIPTAGELAFFCLAGFLGNILSLAVELAVAAHISAGVITLVLSMAPVFTIAIARIMRTERVGRREAFGLTLGAGAATAILLPQAGFAETPLTWVLVAFIAPLGFGFYTVLLAARWPRRLNTLQVATGVVVAATAMLAPLAALEGDLFLIDGRFGAADLALASFALTMGAEYYLLTLITRLSGAIFASCADFVAIATGLFWSFALFNEVPKGWMWLAACLCMAAVFVVNRRTQTAESPIEARL